MPINKPWIDCRSMAPRDIPGTVGAYELGDAEGRVIYIGYAGGRTLTGLRGAMVDHCAGKEDNAVIRARCTRFRYEVTTNYLIRRLELLSRYNEDNGTLPEGNLAAGEPLPPLARYHWKTGT